MALTDNFSRKEGVAFIYSVKLVKLCYTSTRLFRQHADKVEKRANQQEKRRKQSSRKDGNVFIKKDNERLDTHMAACKAALENLGITGSRFLILKITYTALLITTLLSTSP